MHVIRLDGKLKHIPPLFFTRFPEEFLTAGFDFSSQDSLPPLGTPDQVRGDQMHPVFIALIGQVCRFHRQNIHDLQQKGKGESLKTPDHGLKPRGLRRAKAL